MKKVFLIVFVSLIILPTFSLFSFAADPYYFNFPEPETDFRTFYFANDLYIYQFKFLGNGFSSGDVSVIQENYKPYDIECVISESGNYILFYAYNYTFDDVMLACFVYNRQGVLFGNPTSYTVDGAGYTISQSGNYLDPYVKYLRGSDRMNVPVATFNCRLGDNYFVTNRANILWNDDLQEHNDFVNIKSVLDSIFSLETTINTNQTTYFSLVGKFLQDFFYEDNIENNVVSYNWAYYVERIENFAYNMFTFARDFNSWYQNYYNPKTDLTNDLLQDILDYLSQQVEEVTIDDDMSEIDEGVSAREALKVTDANGQEIDAAAQVEVAFSEAASGFGSLGNSVTGVNGLIQQLFFQYPIVLLPVIVALALGLLVTILGKNKSD